MADHGYDELACDLRFGVVVDEEPEPPSRPLSQAVLDHLRNVAASDPGRHEPATPPVGSGHESASGVTPSAPLAPVVLLTNESRPARMRDGS